MWRDEMEGGFNWVIIFALLAVFIALLAVTS